MIGNHLRSSRKHAGIFLSVAVFLVIIAVSPQSRPAHAVSPPPKTAPVPSPTPKERKITFDPSTPATTPGNKVTITAKVLDEEGKEVEPKPDDKWTWKIADPSLREFLFLGVEGPQASIVGLVSSSKTGADIPTMIPIIVTYEGKPNVTGVVNVRLSNAPLARGPIPTPEPQVDITWYVIPQKDVHDNFGSKIKKQYYGIEVTIGNNSGYDLELASVGFDLRAGNLDTTGLISSKIPSAGYRITRGSLQRRQQLNVRNMTLNTIKALGPVLTGFIPFFHNVNHRNNFVEGVNILNNPIEKGLELVWPDLTLSQLANLEDQSLRDNSITRTVVKNNSHVRFVVFVPKDLINDSSKEKEWRDKPLEVMKKLGRMILIGDQVEYINRIRVVNVPDAAAAFSVSGRVIDPCTEGVEGVTVTLNQAGGTSLTATTDAEGRYIFDKVASGLSYTLTPAKTDTTFKTPVGNSFTLQGNRTNIDFFTEPSPFTISGTITKPDGDDDDDEDDALAGAEVKLTSRSGAGTFKARTATTGEDGSYEFTDVPAGAVYIITPTPPEGKTFDKKSLEVPSPNCGEKTYDFKETPKEEETDEEPET